MDIVEKLGNNINKDSEELEKENQRMRNIITTNSFINEFILFLGQVLLIILFSLFYLKGIITSIGLITTLYTIGSTYVFFGNNSLKSLLKVVSFTKIFKKEFIVKDSDLNNKKINKVVEFETICYEDLTFNHPNNSEKVIENFSLKINKGEKILISGKSGVGKTTLLKLLFNPYSRKSGKLKVNETYVEDFDLRSVATYVDQQIVLNKTSIMENINVNKKRVDLDKINYYLEALDLKKKVDSLPNGLDSLLEDNISNISGGEKQRLSIARALLSEKTFFFLDEITSALDKKTAKKCLDLFLKDKNKTVLMIVHDLDDSYIRMFDKVINL
ncbi:ABC transporter ATP-binding protein [Spiroplasma chinense]|uniref:ATP-binding cassette domain-containing protein n=1 Tax=Spiroplasma chinense TaxID=216932 RepID=UPI001AA1927D|nr:ABC transporter ATP-binding protein [Spiroplasma chinense]